MQTLSRSIFRLATNQCARNQIKLASVRWNHTQSNVNSYDESAPQYQEFNENSPVWAWNEWDPLEEVIVGTPEMAVVAPPTPEVLATTPPHKHDFFIKNGGKYWRDVLGKEEWDNMISNMKEFIHILEAEGVKVVQPDVIDHGKEYVTPYFTTKGMDAACPRDMFMVVGDEIIESNMTWRCRYFEFMAFRTIIKDYWKRGAKWTAGPKTLHKPSLINEYHVVPGPEYQENESYVITEAEPSFDSADFIRLGRDILAQKGQTTNSAGIEWVRRHLAPRGIRVHELTFGDPYAMHIDCTFFPVKPGIILQNPMYPCKQREMFDKAGWKIYELPRETRQGEICFASYEYLAMNTIMLDENRCVVEANGEHMIDFLERMGIQCVKVNFASAFGIGGGFHCWTSDTRRRGKLQSYF